MGKHRQETEAQRLDRLARRAAARSDFSNFELERFIAKGAFQTDPENPAPAVGKLLNTAARLWEENQRLRGKRRRQRDVTRRLQALVQSEKGRVALMKEARLGLLGVVSTLTATVIELKAERARAAEARPLEARV